ncbi:MAG: UbiA family prenyltransferase, partial [Planctomycetota bacterium]
MTTVPDLPNTEASPRVAQILRIIAADIKISHTVFAMPFALLGAALALSQQAEPLSAPKITGQILLIVGCMVTARTWAMLVNRIADRKIDAANPRTAGRAIPSGALPTSTALLGAVLFAICFTGLCALFWLFFHNPWPVVLALPTLAWIAGYTFTKRLTALCHVFLGGALAASPLAAAIAIDPTELAAPA